MKWTLNMVVASFFQTFVPVCYITWHHIHIHICTTFLWTEINNWFCELVCVCKNASEPLMGIGQTCQIHKPNLWISFFFFWALWLKQSIRVLTNKLSETEQSTREKNCWGILVPRINVENACIQQISSVVFLRIHAVVRHATLFVWLR
jgi:hypothetical protein